MKTKAWFPVAIAISILGSGCSAAAMRDLLSAGLAAAEAGQTAMQTKAQNVHGDRVDSNGRPDANQAVREALRSPADVSGKWFVCGESDDRFELHAAGDGSNLVTGVPYRQGKPVGRLEGRVEGDRLVLTAHLTTTEFGPSPMRFEYILEGDVLKETRSQGPLLSRRVQSGGMCGGPGRTAGTSYPDPDHAAYPDPDHAAYPDPDHAE